jgi:hypothetical protein
LLKILEEDAPDSIESMNVEQLNAELEKLITQFKAQGLFTRYYVEKSTGRTVDFDDCIPAEKFNADLVGAA